MQAPAPRFQALAAHQERQLYLAAGTELRCRQGSLQLRFTVEPAGAVLALATGQAVRIPAAQAVLVTATAAAQLEVLGTDLPAEAQKNRQGLAGLWRWCAERLVGLWPPTLRT